MFLERGSVEEALELQNEVLYQANFVAIIPIFQNTGSFSYIPEMCSDGTFPLATWREQVIYFNSAEAKPNDFISVKTLQS